MFFCWMFMILHDILWATPSAAGPRPLHSRIADSRHCCKRILAFFGTPTCHIRIFGFLWDTRDYNKGHFEVQAWISIDFWCILLPMVVIWLLGASTLASWGTLGRSWDDPGTILGHWRALGRTLRGPGPYFIDFLVI